MSGTREVVINRCFGGFSLSARAIKAIANRKGMPCFFFRKASDFQGPYTRITDEEAFAETGFFGPSAYQVETPDLIPNQGNWHEMSVDERQASNDEYERINVFNREIERDDPDLVAVVKELGEAAGGKCASLHVVEIPADVDWEISEYDGNEHVAQKHKTWP